jgi:uncharacterized alkaline shock family protein YloU
MNDQKPKENKKKFDAKEFELPETVFVSGIEDKVFQSIVLQCLAQIDGISLTEGNFIEHLLGSEGAEGIYTEQNDKDQSVTIKVEVNIHYGEIIPKKAEEIQTKIAEQLTKLTGLHVAAIHVIFKNVVSIEQAHRISQKNSMQKTAPHSSLEEEYSDEF